MCSLFLFNTREMKSRIGYQFAKGENGFFNTFSAVNDRPNEWKMYKTSLQEVEEMCVLAEQARLPFQKSTLEERAKLLHTIANQLEQNREELIIIYQMESNLPAKRANQELDRTIYQLQLLATFIGSQRFSDEQSSQLFESNTLKRNWHGIGTIAVFGASNFPFAYSTAGGDTAAALAAGCPVIVKAHPFHAGTSWKVAEIILDVLKKLNFPNGVFSHLLDDGFACGTFLVQHSNIKGVGFTGSINGGKALMHIAQQRKQPIPVFAEMGSLNPVVVFPSALEEIEKWANKYAKSIATDAGQFCTKPGVIFVPNDPKGERFAFSLQQELQKEAPKYFVHPGLYTGFKKLVENHFQWIESPKWQAQPTVRIVSMNEFRTNEGLREEFFGPQALLVYYKDKEELENAIHLLDGQLTFSLIGHEKEDGFENILDLAIDRAGRIVFNDVPTGVKVALEMVHGGSYPASSDSRFTAVGPTSIYRFLRPIVVQY